MRSASVVHGPYVNYGESFPNRWQWLFTDYYANLWTNFLGIVVTIAFVRALKIWRRVVALHNAIQHAAAPTEELEIALDSLGARYLLLAWSHIRLRVGFRIRQALPMNWSQILGTLVTGFSFLALFVGGLACGVLTARLSSGSTGLSADEDCGFYYPVNSLDRASNFLSYLNEMEIQSGEHARNCFHATTGTDGCNFFINNSINYTIQHNATCPFRADMCYHGANSALRLATPAVSALRIGINAPKVWEFKRETVCSPLAMNDTFIKRQADRGIWTTSYFYGGVKDTENAGSNLTFRTVDFSTSIGLSAAYITRAYSTLGGFLQPMPALQVTSNETLTLISIQPRKVYHLMPRYDPIFPADKEEMVDGTTYWVYAGGHARILGCVDRTLWRDAAQMWAEWKPFLEGIPKDIADSQSRGGLMLLTFSLLNSNVYQSLATRHGQALNATRSLTGFESRPLATEQWKQEVILAFEVSLSRILIDARAIARGNMKKWRGVVENTGLTSGMRRDMCKNTYLFQTQGWTNINGFWSLLVLVPSLVTIFLSLPTDAENSPRLLFEWLPFAETVSFHVVAAVNNAATTLADGFRSFTANIRRHLAQILAGITSW